METKEQLREELREAHAELRDKMTEMVELAAQERERHLEKINLQAQIKKLKKQPEPIKVRTHDGWDVHMGTDVHYWDKDNGMSILDGDTVIATYRSGSYDKVFFGNRTQEEEEQSCRT